ncbi:hypothetical protein ABH931_005485 [Streptacidiphilus sp. MAP12-33]|uniref:hypothetical protein n=1 Tax=Streptacidiphilus sp. MAP12-33 TaxID=3156266 RepID=UPI003513614F
MRGFLGAVTAYPTVVFTFALVVVVAYWVLVLVGGAHLHGARGGHAGSAGHGGHGGHGGGHAWGHGGQAGHGGGHGGHGGAHGGGHGGQAGHTGQAGHHAPPGQAGAAHGGGHSGGGQSGGGHHWHAAARRAAGLGGVPVTVAVSLVVAFGWFTALACTEWLGGGRWFLLPLALAGGWVGARLLAVPLARMMPEPSPPPSRRDFVGLGCVIRTGRVGPDFGQAEVRSADGSSAVVQVRQSLDDAAGEGGTLRAGAAALIYDYDADGEFFWVMPAPIA